MLYQHYISRTDTRDMEPAVRRFSKNYYGVGPQATPHLCSITDDLQLARPFLSNGGLWIQLKPLAHVKNIPQIHAFVTTALRIPGQPQPPTPSASAPSAVQAPPRQFNCGIASVTALPWSQTISVGTLCMRDFFEKVARARHENKQSLKNLDGNIDAMLRETVVFACGHGSRTVSDMSTFTGVRCQECGRNYWWSFCEMRVAEMHPAYHRSALDKPVPEKAIATVAVPQFDGLWHSGPNKRCFPSDQFWACTTCQTVVEGVARPCPECIKRGKLVYSMDPNECGVTSSLDDVLEAAGLDNNYWLDKSDWETETTQQPPR
eukprot:c17525_g1_i1.p1 GENE.c17525_g1_i1~~c17525_g1_i1.p1  ORF type:complete len:319 (+),score=66.18 c17525_g1_i1:169-1125(+)